MTFLLRLKHWQFFLITFGVPMLANIFGITGHGKEGPLEIGIGMLTVTGIFCWIWSIVNVLQKKIPDLARLKLWTFRVAFLAALSILMWVFWIVKTNARDVEISIILISIFVYLGLMIFVVLFAAKTLKSVELGRPANISEYAPEAFFIWMSPIGVWILQPRLNNLTDNLIRS